MQHYIGIDLGGTSVKLGITDTKGNIVSTYEVPTLAETNSVDMIYENMEDAVKHLLHQNKDKDLSISGIGVGSPGSIDPKEGRIVTGIDNIPALKGFPLAQRLQKKFSLPTFIDNDANNATRGEFLFGAGKGKKNIVMITLGTGIGGGIIIDGELYGGSNNYAGEVGHTTIVAGGKRCSCGNYGCWEAYGSATAMKKSAQSFIEKGVESSLHDFYPDQLNAKVIIDHAKHGDKLALDIFNETCQYIGIGLANLVNIFNPDVCIVGGGVSQAGDFLLKKIEFQTEKYCLPRARVSLKIKAAQLGNQAGILGSAALALMQTKGKRA